jgi:hypothetical protein
MRKGDPTTIIEHKITIIMSAVILDKCILAYLSMVLLREQPTDDDLNLVEGNWVHG